MQGDYGERLESFDPWLTKSQVCPWLSVSISFFSIDKVPISLTVFLIADFGLGIIGLGKAGPENLPSFFIRMNSCAGTVREIRYLKYLNKKWFSLGDYWKHNHTWLLYRTVFANTCRIEYYKIIQHIYVYHDQPIYTTLHWENYISISFHIEWDMIMVTLFLLNQM